MSIFCGVHFQEYSMQCQCQELTAGLPQTQQVLQPSEPSPNAPTAVFYQTVSSRITRSFHDHILCVAYTVINLLLMSHPQHHMKYLSFEVTCVSDTQPDQPNCPPIPQLWLQTSLCLLPLCFSPIPCLPTPAQSLIYVVAQQQHFLSP